MQVPPLGLGWRAFGLVSLAALATGAAAPQEQVTTVPPYPNGGGPAETVASAATGTPGARRFTWSTSQTQRDDGPQRRTVTEGTGPYVASGSDRFDALFALAIDDAHQASVEAIKDDAYNGGRPIACHCFETGSQWHYVWTRDLSYALDLGLAAIDPGRAVDSLMFKTSDIRAGVAVPPEIPAASRQIVQDTGSGGSWPISTDRTAWALGAERTLANLDGSARDRFARAALTALTGTLEADRVAAYDPRDGLYGGEHSFLDWRDQTYAPWILDDLSAMAQMKGLSTNILHYRALRLAARLAGEQGQAALATRYDGWAGSLRGAIGRGFWDAKAGLFATYVSADATPYPIAKYDLLGNDLAILSGIADAAQARTILSRYPFAPYGPPVVWPQAPDQFVYHNRAQWPFVTAYTLAAAARAGHVAAADRSLDALMRGAALHLSNMENLEWLTGRSRFDDGPEINARRQLWSVGGYIGAVTATLFGWHPEADGVRVAPFLTTHMRTLLGPGDTATLARLDYAGRPIAITLRLPPRAAAGGIYPVARILLNGRPAPARITARDLLPGENRIEVTFGKARRSATRVATVAAIPATSHDDPRAFMPATPGLTASAQTDGVRLAITGPAPIAPVRYTLLRDGRPVARDLRTTGWTDRGRDPERTACYSAIATFTSSGLASQPSAAACVRGRSAQTIAIDDPRLSGTGGRLPAGADGVAEPTLLLGTGMRASIADVTIPRAGTYAISLRYDNHVGPLNTGITNGVKRLTLTGPGGRTGGIVQMPHIRSIVDAHPLRASTRVYVTLPAGRYRLDLSDFLNMSALAANATYKGAGGPDGPVNAVRIAAVMIDPV